MEDGVEEKERMGGVDRDRKVAREVEGDLKMETWLERQRGGERWFSSVTMNLMHLHFFQG